MALSGKTGDVLWSLWSDEMPLERILLRDLDGDGALECAIGTIFGSTIVLRASDGELLSMGPGGMVLEPRPGGLLVYDWVSRTISDLEFRPRRYPLATLARYHAWTALENRAALDGDRFWRGLARRHRGDAAGAIQDFREAARLGLKSPELEAEWMLAALDLDPVPESPEVGPEAAVIVVLSVPLNKREKLARSIRGSAPQHLLLRGDADGMLRVLNPDPLSPSTAALRAVAFWMKKDGTRALEELTPALLRCPGSRLYRDLRDEITR
jgi:hypothetical protein